MSPGSQQNVDIKTIAVNRRARYDYFIDERLEAGLALTGTEIKSIREGRVNLRDAYASIDKGEAWLMNTHIAPYDHGNRYNHDPIRPRKLLLHRDEIQSLSRHVNRGGYTVIPLQLYLRHGLAKVELGVARGKKSYDKRQSIAQRDARREVDLALRRVRDSLD